jgi:hypothetical protein
MADRETLENSLESTVCPIERRRLINRLAQRKHRKIRCLSERTELSCV